MPILVEAWDELTRGEHRDSTHLTFKTWVVASKKPVSTTLGLLRDLQMGNEIRKALERLLFQVLDEVCAKTLTRAQQAFCTNREITKNTIKMLSAFARARDETEAGKKDF